MTTPQPQTTPGPDSTESNVYAVQLSSSDRVPSAAQTRPTKKSLAKTFSVMPDDLELIQKLRLEVGLATDSEALRLLIREWQRYRPSK